MNDIVLCHSDFRYAEKPVSFCFSGDSYKISRIISEWRSENGLQFIVVTDQNNKFELKYDELLEQWSIKPLILKEYS